MSPKEEDSPMLKRATAFLVAGLLASTSLGTAGAAETRQIPVMRIHTSAEVAAPPAAVWAQITEGRNFVTWCPMWKKDANAKVALTKVGDAVDFTDQWGGGGRSIVTYLVKDKEIRIAHEPSDGSYMCQAKVILTPGGAGTKVDWWDQYTDESKPEDMKATAAKVAADQTVLLAALKKAAETR
jgi:hypothetical protein